eukprot:Gregarina_sp_Pseudo_9__2154@NODE_2504_length_976_cov_59_826041_g2301_i0_p1_GENE_NODE_2504_length_976_cov_59_826041_g2301_i0NODE_2504_length_976_cov_59_826041_g2301_i0_p1_ORF_typecomplete_len226_score25_63Cnl2_NKP2/PF09447_10/0_024_NODE_2504_length_976_cov_59_826041_g2301_i0198875
MTVTTGGKSVVYSKRYDASLEPARLAYGMSDTHLEESELDGGRIVSAVEARSPNAKLPFAAAEDILIAGPVAILYHAAFKANLMPPATEPRRLLEATMVCELVNNVLKHLAVLGRKPFSLAEQMDVQKDRLLTVEVPEALKLVEVSLESRPALLSGRLLDVGDVSVAALHNYLTELTDIYSAEDFASLFPRVHNVAMDVSQLRSVMDWRCQRNKKLMTNSPRRCY